MQPYEMIIINLLKPILESTIATPIKIKNEASLPNYYGYYCILCDQPVPKGARVHKNATDIMTNGLYIWRDGAGKIRDTVVNRHLFRDVEDRRDGGKANSMKVIQSPIEVFKNTHHNFTPVGDGIHGYENGIHINEDRWNDYNFYLASIEADLLANVFEQTSNVLFGQAPLNLQGKK